MNPSREPVHFIPISCPNCGGDLSISEKSEKAFCSYCGKPFMVLRTPDTVEIKEENFIKLAKLSESTNDLDEAMRYYNKALELNPNNPKTLFGKGSVIIRLSTLEAPKIDQALTYFLEAVDNSVGNQKGEILFNASMEIGQFCHDYSSAAFRNFESLLEKVREDTDAYNDYTQILESSWDILCKQIIFSFNKFDMVLETIQEQQIDEILFNFVFICDYLLKGVPSAYRKEYNGPVEVFIPMLWLFVDSDDQLLIEERFKKYSALIKNKDLRSKITFQKLRKFLLTREKLKLEREIDELEKYKQRIGGSFFSSPNPKEIDSINRNLKTNQARLQEINNKLEIQE